jgi:hypothetical protein
MSDKEENKNSLRKTVATGTRMVAQAEGMAQQTYAGKRRLRRSYHVNEQRQRTFGR